MIILGIVIWVLGIILKIAILTTVGIVIGAVGLVLLLLGVAGHSVGGRRYYY